MMPSQVNESNEVQLWTDQYVTPHMTKKTKSTQKSGKKKKKKKIVFKFKVGDNVRISFLRNPFTREYHEKWTGEVFTVTKRYLRKDIPVYKLKDYDNDSIKGTFYEAELQKIILDPNQVFKIEKIIHTKGKGHNKQHLVKWLHWPTKYNSWIKHSDLQKYK